MKSYKFDYEKFEAFDGGHCYLRATRTPEGFVDLNRFPTRASTEDMAKLGAWSAQQKPNTIPAREVKVAFRKPTGSYVYLRLSESSVDYLKLDPNWVYGVCYNGNVAKMKPDAKVVEMPLIAVLGNEQSEAEWDAKFASPLES